MIRDNNGEIPYQVFVDQTGKSWSHDSRNNGPIPYDCFEEVKNISPEEKDGFQNFYKLREDCVKEYQKFIKS